MKDSEGRTCCECEHASHFDDGDHHPYGTPIEGKTIKVGSWEICEGCKHDHDPSVFIIPPAVS